MLAVLQKADCVACLVQVFAANFAFFNLATEGPPGPTWWISLQGAAGCLWIVYRLRTAMNLRRASTARPF